MRSEYFVCFCLKLSSKEIYKILADKICLIKLLNYICVPCARVPKVKGPFFNYFRARFLLDYYYYYITMRRARTAFAFLMQKNDIFFLITIFLGTIKKKSWLKIVLHKHVVVLALVVIYLRIKSIIYGYIGQERENQLTEEVATATRERHNKKKRHEKYGRRNACERNSYKTTDIVSSIQ